MSKLKTVKSLPPKQPSPSPTQNLVLSAFILSEVEVVEGSHSKLKTANSSLRTIRARWHCHIVNYLSEIPRNKKPPVNLGNLRLISL